MPTTVTTSIRPNSESFYRVGRNLLKARITRISQLTIHCKMRVIPALGYVEVGKRMLPAGNQEQQAAAAASTSQDPSAVTAASGGDVDSQQQPESYVQLRSGLVLQELPSSYANVEDKQWFQEQQKVHQQQQTSKKKGRTGTHNIHKCKKFQKREKFSTAPFKTLCHFVNRRWTRPSRQLGPRLWSSQSNFANRAAVW